MSRMALIAERVCGKVIQAGKEVTNVLVYGGI